jgi:hypothetical protein
MKARHLNMSLLASGGVCTAVGLVPVEALPSWTQVLFGLAGAICLLLTGTRVVEEIEPTESRAKRPHGSGLGIGLIVLLLAPLLWTGALGCGGQQIVEVMPPHFDGIAGARVIVPVVVGGVVIYADAVCEVTAEAPVPVCGVCVEAMGAEVCRCFRGTERIDCPSFPKRPDQASSTIDLSDDPVSEDPAEGVGDDPGAEEEGSSTAPGEGEPSSTLAPPHSHSPACGCAEAT